MKMDRKVETASITVLDPFIESEDSTKSWPEKFGEVVIEVERDSSSKIKEIRVFTTQPKSRLFRIID